jgi:hypothetical protein
MSFTQGLIAHGYMMSSVTKGGKVKVIVKPLPKNHPLRTAPPNEKAMLREMKKHHFIEISRKGRVIYLKPF